MLVPFDSKVPMPFESQSQCLFEHKASAFGALDRRKGLLSGYVQIQRLIGAIAMGRAH